MIRLTRSVSISSFDAEATVAVGRHRPEFLAVARLAADLDRPIAARDVLRELLGLRPAVLGRRVVERCVGLGLLESIGKNGEAKLSEAGRLALDHGKVLVPEEGVWRFFVVDDPLIPQILLHAQRIETDSAQKERRAAKDARARDERRTQSDSPPEILRRRRGALPCKSAQDGHLFQLTELADQGASGPQGKLQLVLTWNPDTEASLSLSGKLPSDDNSTNPNAIDANIDLPELFDDQDYKALWNALVCHATEVKVEELDRWYERAGRPVIPSSFHALSPTSRHAFRRDVEVPESDWEDLGHFDSTFLTDVDIVPVSEADAQTWLAWLQWEAINDYVTPDLLGKTSQEQLRLFPYHQPRALDSSALLAKALIERDDRSWFLLGPSDLGLWS